MNKEKEIFVDKINFRHEYKWSRSINNINGSKIDEAEKMKHDGDDIIRTGPYKRVMFE